MKYNWTEDVLNERIEKLQGMLEKETNTESYESIYSDITDIQEWILDLFYPTPDNEPKLITCYNLEKKELINREFLWTDIIDFGEIIKDSKTPLIESKLSSFSIEDILNITQDFYKSLDRFFYGNFMKNFRKRNDHISFFHHIKIDKGITFFIPTLSESFISVDRQYNIEDIFTTIHEYAHTAAVSINPNHLHIRKTLFSEIDSLFMELVASDYLENLFKNGRALICKGHLHEYYSDYAITVNTILSLLKLEKELNEEYKTNKILKQVAKEKLNIEPLELEKMIKSSQSELTYLISYMFAIELYKLYKEDKEKAFYYLKKFIYLECETEEQYYNNIKKFGLIPNFSLREFDKQIQDDVMKLQRQKPKPVRK